MTSIVEELPFHLTEHLVSLIHDSEKIEDGWKAFALELKSQFCGTMKIFRLKKGVIESAIVSALKVEEQELFSMDVPRKKKNVVDSFSAVRKLKLKVQSKVRYYLIKLKTLMFEDEVVTVKKRKLLNSVNVVDDGGNKNDDYEVNDVGEDEKEDEDDTNKGDDDDEEEDDDEDEDDDEAEKKHPLSRPIHDHYETPLETWKLISDYIPKNAIIWEAFYSNGQSGSHLRSLGFSVIHSDEDFFSNDCGDIVVSNPPFSCMPRIFERLRNLEKPFILIVPPQKLLSKYFNVTFAGCKCDLQLMIPTSRLKFFKLNGKGEYLRDCIYDIVFLCYRMNLPKDLIWL